VDGLAALLRRFRKSHHLIPAGLGAPLGHLRDCSRQHALRRAGRQGPRAYQKN